MKLRIWNFGSLLVSRAGNQIRDKMIRSHPKTDGEKLAGLETFFHKKFPKWSIRVEWFMLFSKGEDEYMGCYKWLDEYQVKNYLVHPPDFYIIRPQQKSLFLELDGPYHDVHVLKTEVRDNLFRHNELDFNVVNEMELKLKLGIPKSRPLTQDQINEAFYEKIMAANQS